MSIENFLIDKRIVKNKNQANYVMIGVIIFCIIYIFSNIFLKNEKKDMKKNNINPADIENLSKVR